MRISLFGTLKDGSESEVTQRIEQLRAAGVDEFSGAPFGTPEDQARTRAVLLSSR